jgi:phage-related protein
VASTLALAFDILARDRASAEFNRVGDAAEKTGHRVSGAGKLAAGAFGGALLGGVAAFTAGLVGGFKEAVSYQKITDQLAQTIKATGGAAGVSVDGLKKYAGQLESMSGVDEELILSSQNVLATFTEIQNKAGVGNDVFNQASLAALNLSTTLGTDVAGAAVQVGKALNDPTKGITALSKAGVSFTQQQKDQIKTLQKSGNTLGAQKIILKELNKEFGGAAAAAGKGFGGTIARLKDTVSDAFRDIATRALPTVSKIAEGLAVVLPKAIAVVSAVLGGLITVGKQVFTTLSNAGIFTALQSAFAAVAAQSGNFRNILSQVSAFVTGTLIPAFQQVATNVFPVVSAAVSTIARVFKQDIIPAFQQVAAFVTGTLVPTLTQVAQTIAANVVPIVKSLAHAFVTNILPALESLYATFTNKVLPVLIRVEGIVVPVISAFVRFAATVLGTVIPPLVRLIGPVLGFLIKAIGTAIGAVFSIIGAFISFGAGIGRAAAAVAGFVSKAIGFFVRFEVGVAEKIIRVVKTVAGLPRKALNSLGNLAVTLYDKGKQLISGFINGVIQAAKSIPGLVGNAIKGGVAAIGGFAGTIVHKIPGFAGGGRPSGLSIVGENGPELFVPDVPGTILSHGASVALSRRLGGASSSSRAAEKAAEKAAKAAAKAVEKAARASIAAYKEQLREKIKMEKGLIKSDEAIITGTRKHIDGIKALLQTYADYAKSIVDSTKQASDVLNAFSGLSAGTLVDSNAVFADGPNKGQATPGVVVGNQQTIDGLIGSQQNSLAVLQRFASEITALGKRGLNKGLIEQLLQAGPSQIGLVDQLFGATDAQIGQLNQVGSQLDSGAAALGKLGVDTKFGAGAQEKANAELVKQTSILASQLAEEKKANAELVKLNKTLAGVGSSAQATARASAGHGGRA